MSNITLLYAFIDPFTVTAAIGVATSAYSLFSSNKEAKKQEQANTQFQQQQNAVATAINSEIGGQDKFYGRLNSATQTRDNLLLQKDQKLTGLRRQAENLQFKESMADFRRATRENFRQSLIASASITNNAASQDVLTSSAFQGGQASVTTQAAAAGTQIYEGRQRTVALNRLGNESYRLSSQFNQSIAGQDRAIANAGSAIGASNRRISQHQTTLSQVQANQQSSNQASAVKQQSNAGLFNTGVSLVQNAGTFSNVLNTALNGTSTPTIGR